ncbi:MAG: 30S ribosome-binding factor RbfA [Bacteroidales bacterium]|nr:30S ribosome-binding factor RbfA [Bacteroidales bacterium]MCF8337369.1 30S ribosome-binding factor RbfA [Bacteroidales bacterium]
METKRQEKISRQIHKDMGEILQRRSPEFNNAMITVTKVHVTKDLSVARIYVSLFATKDKQATLQLIRENINEIRYDLGNRERHQLRKIPELEVYEDDTLDYIDHIDELLDDDK